jgi:hypothetical protein
MGGSLHKELVEYQLYAKPQNHRHPHATSQFTEEGMWQQILYNKYLKKQNLGRTQPFVKGL